jgi:ribosomal protein L4
MPRRFNHGKHPTLPGGGQSFGPRPARKRQSRVLDYHVQQSMQGLYIRNAISAYYMELGLRMKKKKHGQLLSVKDMFKRQQKHVNRRSNRHA